MIQTGSIADINNTKQCHSVEQMGSIRPYVFLTIHFQKDVICLPHDLW